jgi:predicted nucleic acid-binding protein
MNLPGGQQAMLQSEAIPVQAPRKATVFLDAGVVMRLLRGEPNFLAGAAPGRFEFAINPVVLQELTLSLPEAGAFAKLKELADGVKMIPVDMDMTNRFVDRARTLRDRSVHANDLLIAGSAAGCDYFVTDDKALRAQFSDVKPKVLSLAEFREMLGEH